MSPSPDQQGMEINDMRNDEKCQRELDDDYDCYYDHLFVDPRCSQLGVRIIIHKDGS